MTYKHRDIVIAYMEGKQIQARQDNGNWVNLKKVDPKMGIIYSFCDDWEYRIKPETRKYRVALKKGNYTVVCDSKAHEREVESSGNFVRWLTDWVEYEV